MQTLIPLRTQYSALALGDWQVIYEDEKVNIWEKSYFDEKILIVFNYSPRHSNVEFNVNSESAFLESLLNDRSTSAGMG